MLLIITDSRDELTNTVALLIEGQPFFRFNIDLWFQYDFEISHNFWLLKDPKGREITCDSVNSVYVRKPFYNINYLMQFPQGLDDKLKQYIALQVRKFVIELIAINHYHKKVKLIQNNIFLPDSKAAQMQMAAAYFSVPKWQMFWSGKDEVPANGRIAKSIVAAPLPDGRFLFAKQIPKDCVLNKNTPWFIQDLVEAKFDLTIIYIRGQLFSFALDRESFSGIDWRKHIYGTKKLDWKKYAISDMFRQNVDRFMSDMRLHFGRLDFLIDYNGREYFLEVNPEGEWGWLDEDFQNGVFSAFLSEFDVQPSSSNSLIQAKKPL